MGYFVGFDNSQFFVGDDGIVYNAPDKKSVVAESVEKLYEMHKPADEPKEMEADDYGGDKYYTCPTCQEQFIKKMDYVRHAKKHKRATEE